MIIRVKKVKSRGIHKRNGLICKKIDVIVSLENGQRKERYDSLASYWNTRLDRTYLTLD